LRKRIEGLENTVFTQGQQITTQAQRLEELQHLCDTTVPQTKLTISLLSH